MADLKQDDTDYKILASYSREKPQEKEYSDAPINLVEDVYRDPRKTQGNPLDSKTLTNPFENQGVANPFENQGVSNPFGGIADASNPFSTADGSNPLEPKKPTVEPINPEEDEYYKPISTEEYIKAQQQKEADAKFKASALGDAVSTATGALSGIVSEVGTQVDWDGFIDNSLVRHAYEWIKGIGQEDYESSVSIEGRKLAIQDIDNQLEALGPVALSDPAGVRQADDLWEQKNALAYKIHLDEILLNAESPSLDEMATAIYNDPVGFTTMVAQEIVNKPELIFVPQWAAARGAAIASSSAKALGAGAATAKVAKIAGTVTGAYTGGVSLGMADRMIEQGAKTGEVDVAKAYSQSQLDGILGVALTGGGRLLTKATAAYNSKRALDLELTNKAAELSKSEKNLKQAMMDQDLESDVANPQMEMYMDSDNNVYRFEVKDTEESMKLQEELAELEDQALRFEKADPQIKEALQAEIQSRELKLQNENMSIAEASHVQTEVDALRIKLDRTEDRFTISEEMLRGSSRTVDETLNYMQVVDAEGITHTLKRITPKVLKEEAPKIQGYQDIVYGGTDTTQAMASWKAAATEFLVTPLAPVERLKNFSPTAGKLIDMLNPHAGKHGRAAIDTIQEKTHHKQGEFSSRSKAIATTLTPEQKVALGKHMTSKELSEDPVVLEASSKYRELLDDARAYSKEAGMKVDNAKDFLPRYYDQEKLKSPEVREALALEIDKVVDKEGNPRYDPKSVRQSLEDIVNNVSKDTDETGRVAKGGKINPIGHRKWKDVPDSVLYDVFKDDFIGGLERYLNNTAKRTELDRAFGYGGSKLNEMIQQVKDEVTTNSNGTRDLSETEAANLERYYDLLNGSYGDTYGMKQTTDSLLAFQTVTKLPLVTITSLLEPTTMMFRLQEGGKLAAMSKVLTPKALRKAWGDTKIEDIYKEAEEVGLIHDTAIKERLDAMVGEGLEGWPAKVTNKFIKGVMLHQWTEHTRAVAYEASRNEIAKMAKKLSNQPYGKRSEVRRQRLAELGIDPDQAIDWIRTGNNVDHPLYDRIKKSSAKLANTMIANPNKANKGLVASSNSPIARLSSQFKPFGMTFYNDVAKSTYDDIAKQWNGGDRIGALAQAGNLLLVGGSMAYWGAYKSDLMFDQEIEDSPEEIARKLVVGSASYLVPFGSTLSQAVAGEQSLIGAMVGPTAGDLEKVAKFTKGAFEGDPNPKVLKGVVPLIKRVEEAVE